MLVQVITGTIDRECYPKTEKLAALENCFLSQSRLDEKEANSKRDKLLKCREPGCSFQRESLASSEVGRTLVTETQL